VYSPPCTLAAVTPSKPPQIESLEGVADPVERAHRALMAMEDARNLMEGLAATRARAVYELYCAHGASKAARLLGISRVNLYRIIGQVPEVRQQRIATAVELAAVVLAATNANTADTQQLSPLRVSEGGVSTCN
jgi:hypothetical protein